VQASINNTGYGSNEMGENLPAIGLGTGKTADQMVASVLHTCALLNDGNSKCWGAGRCGRLGQGGINNIGDSSNEMEDNLTATNLRLAWTVCQVGEKVIVNGSATSGCQCAACVSSYNNATNQYSCTPWAVCQSNEVVSKEGSATTDRECMENGAVASDVATSAVSAIVICSVVVVSAMLGALIYFHCFLKPADKKKQESREIQMAKV
jgi:hypothetical protein